MKKIWLVIIVIVFGIIILGNAGSDNGNGNSIQKEQITINGSDIANFELPEKCVFTKGIICSKSIGQINEIEFDKFTVKYILVENIYKDIYSAAFKYHDMMTHKDVIVNIDVNQ